MIVFRALAGVGSGIYLTSAQLTTLGVAAPDRRSRFLGANQTGLIASVSVGPAVGGLLGEAFGLRSALVIVGIVSAIGGSAVLVRLPLRRRAPVAAATVAAEDGNDSADQRGVLRAPFLMACSVGFVVFGTRLGSRQTLLPLIASIRFAIPVGALGLLFSAMSLVSLAVLTWASRVGDRFGRVRMIAPALLVAAVGLIVLGWAGSPAWLWVGGSILAAGLATAGPAPAAWAADSTPPRQHGVAMSSFRTDIGSLAGPVLLASLAAATTFSAALGVNALLLAVVAVLVFLVGRRSSGPLDVGP